MFHRPGKGQPGQPGERRHREAESIEAASRGQENLPDGLEQKSGEGADDGGGDSCTKCTK